MSKKGNKGLVGESENFLKAAQKFNEAQKGKPKGKPHPTEEVESQSNENLGGAASKFKDAAANLEAKTYAEAKLIPMIDQFVEEHKKGKAATKDEITQFYNDVLNQMQKDGRITAQEVQDFKKPSKVVETYQEEGKGFFGGKKTVTKERTVDGPSPFDEAVKGTKDLIDKGDLSPKLGLKDKMMYGLGKLLGDNAVGNFFMKKIDPENLSKINKLENTLAGAIKHVGTISKHQDQKAGKAGDFAAKIVEKRTQNRGGEGQSR